MPFAVRRDEQMADMNRYNDEINESRRRAREGGAYDDMSLDSVPPDPIFSNGVQIVTTLFWSAVQLDG